ncbi:MAG: OmpA family protein [Myxococcota bacterium]
MRKFPSVVSSVVLSLAFGACGSVEKKSSGDQSTAAEKALDAHRDELLAIPGIVAVAVTPDRKAIAVTACTREAADRVDPKAVGAKIETTLEPNYAGCRPAPMPTHVEIRDTIDFAKDSDDLRGDARQVIANVARTLSDNPSLRIDIVGHASSGEKQRSMLATRRAQAVRKALEEQGIDKVRLILAGDDAGRSESSVTFEVHTAP